MECNSRRVLRQRCLTLHEDTTKAGRFPKAPAHIEIFNSTSRSQTLILIRTLISIMLLSLEELFNNSSRDNSIILIRVLIRISVCDLDVELNISICAGAYRKGSVRPNIFT